MVTSAVSYLLSKLTAVQTIVTGVNVCTKWLFVSIVCILEKRFRVYYLCKHQIATTTFTSM